MGTTGKLYISAEAHVDNSATVAGQAQIGAGSSVLNKARVTSNAHVQSGATVKDHALVFGNAWVMNDAVVGGNARIGGYAHVYGDAEVCGQVIIAGNARVYDNARVFGNAFVDGNAYVGRGAEVFRPSHVITIGGCLEGAVTVFRTRGGGHKVKAGCQVFQLTDNVKDIADVQGWYLPNGWQDMRKALLAMVQTWKDDEPDPFMDYPESWGITRTWKTVQADVVTGVDQG